MSRTAFLPFRHELVLDWFAGGGGASTGIEAAIGRPVDLAVNHSGPALAMHAANHPRSRHICSDVFEVDPIAVTRGQPVGADYEPLPLGDDLRAWWMQRLDQGGRMMLETLAAAYPRGIDRDELSERTGYARSTRDRLLQELRARKLVESRGREVFASEALFG